jgi:hypothetical protein
MEIVENVAIQKFLAEDIILAMILIIAIMAIFLQKIHV